MAFEILSWNYPERNYERLLQEFQFSIGPAPTLLSDLIGIEVEIHPASFLNHKTNGWAVTFWNHGWGRTEAEAHDNWATGVRLVQQFFAQQRMKYERELNKGLPTIS